MARGDVFRDSDGKSYVEAESGRYWPVTDNEAIGAIQARDGSGFGGGLARGAEQIGAGILGILGDDVSLEKSRQLAAQQRGAEINSPWGSLLGNITAQAIPGIAATAAVGPAGIPAMIGAGAATEGVVSASMSPESPLAAGLIGATLGAFPGVSYSAPAATRVARAKIADLAAGPADVVLTAEQQAARPTWLPGDVTLDAAAPRPPGLDPSTPAGRVRAAIEDAAAPGGRRWQEGIIPEEILKLEGADLTPGMSKFVNARANNLIEQRDAMRLMEKEQRMAKLHGGRYADKQFAAEQSLRNALDNTIRRATDFPEGVAFTDNAVGTRLEEVGADIGKLMQRAGTMHMDMTRVSSVLDPLTASNQTPIKKIIKDFGTGVLSPEQHQSIYSKLRKLTEGPNDPSVIHAATQLIKQMEDQASKSLGQIELDALKKSRYQYRILKRLERARDREGSVQPGRFLGRWRQGGKTRGSTKDPLGNMAWTVHNLTASRVNAGTTLQRTIEGVSPAVGKFVRNLVPGMSGLRR